MIKLCLFFIVETKMKEKLHREVNKRWKVILICFLFCAQLDYKLILLVYGIHTYSSTYPTVGDRGRPSSKHTYIPEKYSSEQ